MRRIKNTLPESVWDDLVAVIRHKSSCVYTGSIKRGYAGRSVEFRDSYRDIRLKWRSTVIGTMIPNYSGIHFSALIIADGIRILYTHYFANDNNGYPVFRSHFVNIKSSLSVEEVEEFISNILLTK
jgi:hypothetical protein